ncbi:MAG: bacillithiol biosynthesis cysteine-adding enzyme BshC [Gemmatimonadetes bacterium]|nr:bacillithiol biosynthesis cysteine-adding enzyme BshC [Gemmatimonadota bacterium]
MPVDNVTIRVEAVPALTPPLVKRYFKGDSDLTPLYAHTPFDPARPPGSLADGRSFDDDLIERTSKLNRDAGASARSLSNCEKLRDPAVHAVLAGQQPGLMLGPLFVLYKIVTLVARCRAWESRSGRSYVPVFWIASHDADLPEIDHVYLPGSGGEPEKLRYPWTEIPRQQLGAYDITEADWNAFTDTLRERLPDNEFREHALARFAPSRFPASTTLAFAAAVHALLPDAGIVCFDGRDAETCAAGRSFLARTVREPARTLQAWRDGEEAVRSAGMSPPLDLAESRFPLFVVEDDVRQPMTWNGARFETAAEAFEPEALANSIENGTRTVSPNAGLRPLLQDLLFATSATVAGQSELAYHPQLASLYESAGIERPVLVPRASLSLVHFRAYDQLADLGLTVADLRKPDESAREGAAGDQHAESRARFMKTIESAWNSFADEAAAESNASPVPGADDTTSHFLKAAARAAGKFAKEADRAGENRSRKIHKLTQDLAPKGTAQEFVWSILPFLARYGPDFAALVADSLPEDSAEHLMMTVDPRGAS